jgi:AraC-like DNA-binding protein
MSLKKRRILLSCRDMSVTLDLPENAIRAFETWSGLRVTVHDIGRTLWQFLSPDRWIHRIGLCDAVKESPHGARCIEFAMKRLRAEIPDYPDGRIHVCPAGLVEWVVPKFNEGALEWVFFAGVRYPGRGLTAAVPRPGPPLRPSPWPAGVRMPEPVQDEEAQLLLEGLRQLVARVQLWSRDFEQSVAPDPSSRRDLATRRTIILRFVQHRHTRPVALADLARALHLSESRAAHLTAEVFGRTFVDLVTEARVRTACALLCHSGLSVLEVAYRSGFGDASHFHRVFKRLMGVTPARYRRSAEALGRKP